MRPGRMRGRRMALATAAAAVVLAFALVGHSAESEPAHTQRLELRDAVGPSKVAVLILENRSYGQVIGSPKAPYLNSLARRGALETRYYAVTHPSLPNYIALTTGGYKTVESDCTTCGARGR